MTKSDATLDAHTRAAPFETIVDLNSLTEAGTVVELAPGQAERARIAGWSDVSAIPEFSGVVTVKRLSSTGFAYEAELTATVIQPCSVTLEPVSQKIALRFARELHLARSKRRGEPVDLAPGLGEDDLPEEVENSRYNVAGPVLEEFSLAIDPYPRAEGAAFELQPAEKPPSPFAVLARLKDPE